MSNVVNIVNNLVPVSLFNKGKAAQIFDRLKSQKELVVVKNNKAEAIILSCEEYSRLKEMEEDYVLLLEACQRLMDNKGQSTIPFNELIKDLGITKKQLQVLDDVKIE